MTTSERDTKLLELELAKNKIKKILDCKKANKLNKDVKEKFQRLVDNYDTSKSTIETLDLTDPRTEDAINRIVDEYVNCEKECAEFMDKHPEAFREKEDLLEFFDVGVDNLTTVQSSDKFAYLNEEDQNIINDMLTNAADRRNTIDSTDMSNEEAVRTACNISDDYREAGEKYKKRIESRKVIKRKTKAEMTDAQRQAIKDARNKALTKIAFGVAAVAIIAFMVLALRSCGKDKANTSTSSDATPSTTMADTTIPDTTIPEEIQTDILKGIEGFDINSFNLQDYNQLAGAAKTIYANLEDKTQEILSIRQIEEALILANLDKLPEDVQGKYFTSPEHLAQATYVAGQVICDPNVNSNNVIKSGHVILTDAELGRILDFTTNGKLTLEDFKDTKVDGGYDLYLVEELCQAKMQGKDKADLYTKVFIELDVETTLEFNVPVNAAETDYSYLYTTMGIMNQADDFVEQNLNDQEMTAIYGSNRAASICPTEVIRQQKVTDFHGNFCTPGEINMYIDSEGYEWPESYVKFDENGNGTVTFVVAVDEDLVPTEYATRSVTFNRTVLSNQFLDAGSDYVDALCNPENNGFSR